MTAHALPYTLDADRAASAWTELCAALGERPRHLAGSHMRSFVDEAFALQAEITAGFFPGGRHVATEDVAA